MTRFLAIWLPFFFLAEPTIGALRTGDAVSIPIQIGKGVGPVSSDRPEIPADARATAAALAWLSRQQSADGSWSCASGDAGGNHGSWNCRVGATALSLLPFFGAGQSQSGKGPYKGTIERGLDWLVRRQQESGRFADGDDTSRLSHALATLAVCEAYAASKDKAIGRSAHSGLTFLLQNQDESSGGWATMPKRPANAELTAWHLWALESGARSGLNVPKKSLHDAQQFLRASKWGIEYVDELERIPQSADVVWTLHATVFLNAQQHKDDDAGDAWEIWDRQLRTSFCDLQSKSGADVGSWFDPQEVRAKLGGRLFQTAINTLSMEVHYRYLKVFFVPER